MRYPHLIQAKASPEDLEIIKRNADAAGLSVSAYLRECATRREVRSTIDVRVLSTLGATLAELRRIGGLVKQMHAAGNHQEAARVAAGLDGIKRAVEQMRESVRHDR